MKTSSTTHGQASRGKKSRAYIVWQAMRQRCLNTTNPKYRRYGGRGIRICERWMVFANFVSDMGERPAGGTLDRINNDGNYEIGNCRWTTPRQQQNNRSNNRVLTMHGKKATVAEWARRTGIGRETIEKRLKHGWTVERAVTEPPDPTAGRFKPGHR